MKRQWDHCLPNIMKVLEDFIAHEQKVLCGCQETVKSLNCKHVLEPQAFKPQVVEHIRLSKLKS